MSQEPRVAGPGLPALDPRPFTHVALPVCVGWNVRVAWRDPGLSFSLSDDWAREAGAPRSSPEE